MALNPGDELAWYNLADLQEDAGHLDEAIESLRAAVKASPSFADGHFNLASCLAADGRDEDAVHHWQRYVRLDPDSEWASIARRQLAKAELSPSPGRRP